MRAVTAEEIEMITGGLTKKAPTRLRPMLKKPPPTSTEPPVNVYPPTSWTPPSSSPPPTSQPPPSSGGGGSGTTDPDKQAETAASAGYSFITGGMDVYLPYIHNHENTSATIVNVPSDNSGITVGYGVDLHVQDATHLQADEADGYISKALEGTLVSLSGLEGDAARSALAKSGLQPIGGGQYEFAASDAPMLENLSNVVYGEIMTSVNGAYQDATSSSTQVDGITTRESLVYLPTETQTAITDVSIWYGANNVQTKIGSGDFWGNITTFNWTGAVNTMHNVANAYMQAYNDGTDPNGKGAANRLNSDASLLQWNIDHGQVVNGLGTAQYNDQQGGNDPILT